MQYIMLEQVRFGPGLTFIQIWREPTNPSAEQLTQRVLYLARLLRCMPIGCRYVSPKIWALRKAFGRKIDFSC